MQFSRHFLVLAIFFSPILAALNGIAPRQGDMGIYSNSSSTTTSGSTGAKSKTVTKTGTPTVKTNTATSTATSSTSVLATASNAAAGHDFSVCTPLICPLALCPGPLKNCANEWNRCYPLRSLVSGVYLLLLESMAHRRRNKGRSIGY